MPTANTAAEFTKYAHGKLTQDLSQIVCCAAVLGVEQIWSRPNEHTNSIGNLILHLTGNVRQWIVAGLGGESFERDRPAEFAERGPLPTDEIVKALTNVVERACTVIAGLDAESLARRRTIQDYDVSTLAAVFHVVEHFSFHTGQIIHATKWLADVDLSLYDERGHRRPGMGNVP